MSNAKTEQLGLRITPAAKALVQHAAAYEHRSVSNMVEHLIFKYCEENDISAVSLEKVAVKQTKKGEKQ